MKSDNTSMQAMVVSTSPLGRCGGVFGKITRFLDSARQEQGLKPSSASF